MAITWAYSLDSDKPYIKTYDAAQTGDTIATQTNGTAGAYTPAKGDVVSFNDQGRVSEALNASNYITATNVLGVCDGSNFRGLAEGGTYAAVTVTQNREKNVLAYVYNSSQDVYRIDLKSGAAAPVNGTAYVIYLDATNGPQLDTANTSGTALLEVIDYDPDLGDNGVAYAVINALQVN